LPIDLLNTNPIVHQTENNREQTIEEISGEGETIEKPVNPLAQMLILTPS